MILKIVFGFLFLNGFIRFGFSEDDISYFHFGSDENWDSRVAKYVDTYINEENFKDEIENYERIFTNPQPKLFPEHFDRSDTLNFKNFDSVFPSRKQDFFAHNFENDHFEYTTRKHEPTTESNNDFVQSDKYHYKKDKHQRPNFQTKNYNNSNGKYHSSSYIQKIPKPYKDVEETTKLYDRYEEIEMIKQPTNNNNSKARINNMLKRFLAQLYAQKFNDTLNTTNDKPKSPKNDLDDEKSKFLNSDALWALKNKTINKFKCNATGPSGTYQGLCYTPTECTNMGGMALGNCADGYGVCCIYRGTCAGWASQNCSYFESPNYPDYYPNGGGTQSPSTVIPMTENPLTPDPRLPSWYYQGNEIGSSLSNLMQTLNTMGHPSSDHLDFEISRQYSDAVSCSFQVYKTNNNIRQFRIDFLDLELASPTDGTCTDERLVISGEGVTMQLPIICGYNTGQHVYVDVSMLTGPLQLMVLSSSGMAKKFKIRICQLEDSCSTQSSNCLQYYTGVSGTIQSFNYDQAAMFNRSTPGYLNNLNYAICIRREAGYCSITYTNVRNDMEYPFQLRNTDENGDLTVPIGEAGVDILNCPDDYIVIDGTRLCGGKLNDGSTVTDFTMNAPITDISTGPIVVQVRTNNAVTGVGFKLFYMQNPCTV